MKKKKYCYCIYCGRKYSIEEKKCSNCKKKLKQKDTEIIDYIKEKTCDKITDNIFDTIKAFIKSHTYGMVLTVTVIGVITTNIIVEHNKNEKIVNSKPDIITTKSYNDPDILMNDFIKYYDEKNINKINTMLYKNYHPNDMDRYTLDNTNINLFSGWDLWLNSSHFYDKRVTDVTTDERGVALSYIPVISELINEGKTVKETYLTIYYCLEEACDESYDVYSVSFDISLVEENGNWYIVDTQCANGGLDNFISVNGDVSKMTNLNKNIHY